MPVGYRPPQFDGDYYTMEVAFRASMIKLALDEYVEEFNDPNCAKKGGYHYKDAAYEGRGL